MRKSAFIFGLVFLTAVGCQASDPLMKVAREFGKSMSKLNKPRVGILSFPYHDGKTSSGSSILSERLTTYMASIKGVRLVERNLLQKILEEQKLSETGAVDAGAAQKIGKILDLDVIITGTLIDEDEGQTELNARALKADTGEVIAARQVTVDRTWSDAPHSPHPLGRQINPPQEVDEKPAPNEKIEAGYPVGRGRMRRY